MLRLLSIPALVLFLLLFILGKIFRGELRRLHAIFYRRNRVINLVSEQHTELGLWDTGWPRHRLVEIYLARMAGPGDLDRRDFLWGSLLSSNWQHHCSTCLRSFRNSICDNRILRY